VRRQRGRQVAPCGHASTVGQRFLRLVLRDDQEERCSRRAPSCRCWPGLSHRAGSTTRRTGKRRNSTASPSTSPRRCHLDPTLSGGPVLQLATIVAASAIR
jgi:hypothetical protein